MKIKKIHLQNVWLLFLSLLGIIGLIKGRTLFILAGILISHSLYVYKNKKKLDQKFVFFKISKKEKKKYFLISLSWLVLGILIFYSGYRFNDLILIMMGIASFIIAVARLVNYSFSHQ